MRSAPILAPRPTDFCEHSACADGGSSPQQRDRRLDRFVRSAYIRVAGGIHVASTVAARALAWNHWRHPPWRTIDAPAAALALAGIAGAAIHSSVATSGSPFGSIALFGVISGRIVRSGPT
jgi:hypothetical protein